MSKRLYAQLQPDSDGLVHLQHVQQHIPARGRRVSPSRLHLTMIHFGIIDEIVSKLPCDEQTAAKAIASYVMATKTILSSYPEQSFTLQPRDFALFGAMGHTLVIRYSTTPALDDLHRRLLHALKSFLGDCGITDIESYMRHDLNFKQALTIEPHITIAKGYDGKLPLQYMLSPVTMTIMPFEYDQP